MGAFLFATVWGCSVPNGMIKWLMQQEVTIDTAGRVVLLKRVRDRLRLEPGDALQLDDDDEQITMRPVRRPAVLRKELGVWSTGAALDHGVGEVPQKDRYHHDRDAAVSQKLFEFRAAALFDGVGKYRRQDSEEADEVEYPTQRRNNRGDAGRNEGERCTDNDLRRDDQREAVKPDERYGARTADQCATSSSVRLKVTWSIIAPAGVCATTVAKPADDVATPIADASQ